MLFNFFKYLGPYSAPYLKGLSISKVMNKMRTMNERMKKFGNK